MELKKINESKYCFCGKPNFRYDNDTKPIYKLYEFGLPQTKIFICEDCLKELTSKFNNLIKKEKEDEGK